MNLIPKCNQTIRTRNIHISIFRCRTDCFKYSLFLSTLRDRFNLDDNIRNSKSISVFNNRLLLFIRPVQNSVFNIFDQKGLKLLTCLRLGFNHLGKHKFWHNFENCVNPLCSCSLEAGDTLHNFESSSDNIKIEILLHGDSRLDNNKNKFILEATLNYIKTSERFSGSLFE